MPKMRINCPNCRQPILADIEQLFDIGVDQSAKQRLLSGSVNVTQCPHCGYKGNLATPIVYHDPDKELLLTYFPPEMGLQVNEQERQLGGLINRVVDNLPQEKRKGYLLRPQSILTFQGLLERILEADGITKEMIQAQQARINLIQRLMNATPEARLDIARNEDKLIDSEFFALLANLIDAAAASGDQQSAESLDELQKAIIPETTYGRQVQEQSREVEAAIKSLQGAGKELTREKLLDLLIEAPNDTRLNALVSLARPGLDYGFFQLLTEKIEHSPDDTRAKLVQLRERLLEMTHQIDQQIQARARQARRSLELILQADDIQDAITQNLAAIDDFFLRELNGAMEEARKSSDLDRISKLQEVVKVIQEASQAPPEIAFIEELLDAPDEQSRGELLQANREQITSEFLDALTNVLAQVEGSGDKELSEKLKTVHRQALRFSMEMKFNG